MKLSTVFISYSHKDEELRERLDAHLSTLKSQQLVQAWHDRRIKAGDVFDSAISAALDKADVILLLVSADFLDSSYIQDIELKRAMARHQAGEACVIPVILRHCDWKSAPFGRLAAAPKDGLPILSKHWPYIDEAFEDVVAKIRAALPPDGRLTAIPATVQPIEKSRLAFQVKPPNGQGFIFEFPTTDQNGASKEITIGRSPDNDLIIANDLTVSRHHCVATVGPESVHIEDQGSTNGLVINGVETKSGELKLNQILNLGYTRLVLKSNL